MENATETQETAKQEEVTENTDGRKTARTKIPKAKKEPKTHLNKLTVEVEVTHGPLTFRTQTPWSLAGTTAKKLHAYAVKSFKEFEQYEKFDSVAYWLPVKGNANNGEKPREIPNALPPLVGKEQLGKELTRVLMEPSIPIPQIPQESIAELNQKYAPALAALHLAFSDILHKHPEWGPEYAIPYIDRHDGYPSVLGMLSGQGISVKDTGELLALLKATPWLIFNEDGMSFWPKTS